jgi:hypothetical protein
MNYLKPGILCLFVICICVTVSAQKVFTPKEPEIKTARLFKDLPDRLPVSASMLLPLLSLKTGQATSINISDKLVFRGTVSSAASKYNDAIKSIVIKLDDRPGATFTVSRIKNPDGTVNYRGRIISFQHGDCFELKNENGQYSLVKKKFEDMVND